MKTNSRHLYMQFTAEMDEDRTSLDFLFKFITEEVESMRFCERDVVET